MDLCVHFGKPAFIVFISLYLYFGFQINIFQFNSIQRGSQCLKIKIMVQRSRREVVFTKTRAMKHKFLGFVNVKPVKNVRKRRIFL